MTERTTRRWHARAGRSTGARGAERSRLAQWRVALGALATMVLGSATLSAQERGAPALASALAGIGTTGRVLMIAAHPDDEDTNLLAWLARGRHVETAYLALTRGDGGQNLIGNELGESLGAIRTEELLAARRIDGARQFFTRAYDFGFSKSPEETLEHWPRDSVLGDVVRVVRAYRPQVIVSVFSGTPRDGHGHHQLAGRLAREVYDVAADTVRFPVAMFGPAWTVSKFYRSARGTPDDSTLRINVGEFNAALGRSYAEIAADSRSQHKSQGFGVLQRKGVVWTAVRREASRVTTSGREQSLFDGIDTTWQAQLGRIADATARARVDSALALVATIRREIRLDDPAPIVPALARALTLLRSARAALPAGPPALVAASRSAPAVLLPTPRGDAPGLDAALHDALAVTLARTERALILAAGVAVEATAARPVVPMAIRAPVELPDTVSVGVTLYNRGRQAVTWRAVQVARAAGSGGDTTVAPDSSVRRTVVAASTIPTAPWWRVTPRVGDLYRAPIDARDELERGAEGTLTATLDLLIADVPVTVRAPVVNRFADPVKGEQQRPVLVVPGVTISLEESAGYARADTPLDRTIVVRVRSAYPEAMRVGVTLQLPPGLRADSIWRSRLVAPGADTAIVYRIRGRIGPGRYPVLATANYAGVEVGAGYVEVAYDHIAPQLLFTSAGMWLQAVPVVIPPRTNVAWVQGVGDNGPAALEQLGIPVTVFTADQVATTDFARFSAVVVGPRAYEAQPTLKRSGARLLEYARRGGTLVVQYGQYEMLEPGVMPYPITLTRPAARVTLEQAPVTPLAPQHPLWRGPNRIGDDDFAGWVQERALYMPSTFDSRYTPLVAMRDPGEPENRGALLVAPLGRGTYVYTTLSLFRQLPMAVPGAARLLVNLLAARPSAAPVP